jgi:hypothetical protein
MIPIRRNKEGHAIATLHYSCDPSKNNEAWISNTEKMYLGGRNSALWRREMELDYGAGGGELVFPTFPEMERHIVVDPYEIPVASSLYGGLDWGLVNPCSFHVYEYSITGVWTAVWEWYQKDVPSIEAACQAIRLCPYYDSIEWIACDPTMYKEDQYTQTGKTSIASLFLQQPENLLVDKLMPAHYRSDALMVEHVRSMWNRSPVTFRMSRLCPNLISEYRNLKFQTAREGMNSSEKLVNADNHAWDDSKYARLSHPSYKTIDKKDKAGTIGAYNKTAERARQIAADTGRDVQEVFYDIYEAPPAGQFYAE